MQGDARPARRGSPRLASGLLAVVLFAGGLTAVSSLPASADGSPPPEAFVLVDAGTGAVITARHMHEALPPASTAKIMTALVAVERLPLDATIPVSPGSVSTMPAADLATSVAVDTAMPICAWRNAGASLAPSPHMPTVCPAF